MQTLSTEKSVYSKTERPNVITPYHENKQAEIKPSLQAFSDKDIKPLVYRIRLSPEDRVDDERR